MIKHNDLKCYDYDLFKNIRSTHTFSGPNGNSWIDHVIGDTEYHKIIGNIRIELEPVNTSDHHSLQVSLNLSHANIEILNSTAKNKKREYINWIDGEIRISYKKKLEININKIKPIEADQIISKEMINKLYDEIVNCLLKTKDEIMVERRSVKKHKFKRRKAWWNEELKQLKYKISETYAKRNSLILKTKS